MKYTHQDIPIHYPIDMMLHIGPYLYGRLQSYGVVYAKDLLNFLDDFVNDILTGGVPIREAKEELTQWLSEVTQNARPLQCTNNNTRVRQNKEYAYQIRYANKNAFNEIVKLWRYHTQPNTVHRRVIPALKTPRTNAFPIGCRRRQ